MDESTFFHTCTHANTHTVIPTYSHPHIHTCSLAYPHPHTHRHTYTAYTPHTHTRSLAYAHPHTRTYTLTDIHILSPPTHTHIHTVQCTDTHIHGCKDGLVNSLHVYTYNIPFVGTHARLHVSLARRDLILVLLTLLSDENGGMSKEYLTEWLQ